MLPYLPMQFPRAGAQPSCPTLRMSPSWTMWRRRLMLSGDSLTPPAAVQPGAPGAAAGSPVGPANVIVMANATRRFGNLTALEDLSLTVPAGSTLGVIGPSGAGKTTTVRLLTG